MSVESNVQLDERPPFWLFRLPDQVHPGFLRGFVGLTRVTRNAGTDDIFPGGGPASLPGVDMIQVQILSIEDFPAILAAVLISLKNIVPGEFDLFFREPVEDHQDDDFGNSKPEPDGVNAFWMRFLIGEILPLREVESVEFSVTPVHDHLCMAFKHQGERSSYRANVNRLPEAV